MNELFKALADPNRRKILKLLKKRSLSVGEILKNFHMTGASLNHHLNILRNARLVDSRKKGQQVIYSINTTVFQDILEWIYDLKGEDHENQ